LTVHFKSDSAERLLRLYSNCIISKSSKQDDKDSLVFFCQAFPSIFISFELKNMIFSLQRQLFLTTTQKL